jgi:hypothetical protein
MKIHFLLHGSGLERPKNDSNPVVRIGVSDIWIFSAQVHSHMSVKPLVRVPRLSDVDRNALPILGLLRIDVKPGKKRLS